MTSTNDHTSAVPPSTEPGLRQRLEAVLPPWTHWGGGLVGPTTAKWTMPGGTWSLWLGGLGSPWPRLEGPGGTWTFGSEDAEHIIGVLRALDAIDAGSQPGRYCDALCRDVEEDRDRLAAEVEQLRYERTLLGHARRLLDRVADGEGGWAGIQQQAGDLAQRIVDEIGHPVTDEPALGPELRAELAQAVAERDSLRQRLRVTSDALNDARNQLHAIQEIAADLHGARYPGAAFDAIADRLDGALRNDATVSPFPRLAAP